jgi:site-specific DNA-adenine methylase
MNNEQLLQMYDAIRQQPDLLVKAAAGHLQVIILFKF